MHSGGERGDVIFSWSAGDARTGAGAHYIKDSGTIRRFLGWVHERVRGEESGPGAGGALRQRYRRPINNDREFTFKGEPEELHVRFLASEGDAGPLGRKYVSVHTSRRTLPTREIYRAAPETVNVILKE